MSEAARVDPAGDGSPAGQPTAAAPAAPAAPVVNPANALTVLRLLLVPVFVILLLWRGGESETLRITATAVFLLAGVTDRLDGEIARRRNLVTAFGQIADPIADKALIGAALVGLSLLSLLSWWVTVVVLAREIGVTVLRLWVIRHGVILASRGGKVKTLLQGVAIGLYLLPLTGWAASAQAWVMAAAVVVTVVTGADYVVRALTLRSTSDRAIAKRARARAEAAGDVSDPQTAASERLGTSPAARERRSHR